MSVSLLTLGAAGGDSGLSGAFQNHTAIVVPLLILLGAVLTVGLVLAVLVHRYRSAPGLAVSRIKPTARRTNSPEEGEPESMCFDAPSRWLAVRSHDLPAVQRTLGLHNPTPCSWSEGIARLNEQRLFISPPLNGWILVISPRLPDPSDDVDACFRFLLRVSCELGEVQFFSVNRAVGHHAWARFASGRAIRGYAWAGDTLWNEGRLTWAERKLGLRCYNYFEGATPGIVQSENIRANVERIYSLAAMWSVDPATAGGDRLSDELGVAGDLSPAKLR